MINAKEQNAITLITLVITIVVMIILASVAINLTLGDNGIFTKAKEAKNQMEIATTKEQIQMDILTEELGNSGNISEDTLKEILTKYGELSNEEKIEDKTLTTNEGHEIKVSDIFSGETGEGETGGETNTPLNKLINPSNYGDYVEYPIDLNGDTDITNDWKIFYNDSKHIFIIPASYVVSTSKYLKLADAGMRSYQTYGLSWDSSKNPTYNVNSSTLSLFRQGLTNYSYTSGKCASSFLDTSLWDNFVDTNYASSAIGSPTLGMWVASYNENGYTKLGYNEGSTGYYVGTATSASDGSISITNLDSNGYDNSLYFPYKTAEGTCVGYWLSSPRCGDTSMLLSIAIDGSISGKKTTISTVGIRPVVCLNEEIKGTKDGNNIWVLSTQNQE